MARYKQIFVNGKRISEHRFIWMQAFGQIPSNFHIHHKNGDHRDNRLENLECIAPDDHYSIHKTHTLLTLYRRHVKICPHRSRKWRRCQCPIHVCGSLGGKKIKRSMDLTSWEAATQRVHEWEALGSFEVIIPIPVAEAIRLFLDDAKARRLTKATIEKHRFLLLQQLQPFCLKRGLNHLLDVNVQVLRDFRGEWADSPISALKKLERLRSFFRFALESEWIETNPAKRLKSPIVHERPTLPFTSEEEKAILTACDSYPTQNSFGYDNRARVRAFILVLLHTGLRIRDVVCLERCKVQDDTVFLYTQKTGVPVLLPLPTHVIQALFVLPQDTQYYFWTGQGDPKSAVADWQRSLRRLFKIACVMDAHAHRFRDSFSVRLLESGVPLQDVSVLLGHRSVRVTEKHYAPWVKSRQDRLAELVRSSW